MNTHTVIEKFINYMNNTWRTRVLKCIKFAVWT